MHISVNVKGRQRVELLQQVVVGLRLLDQNLLDQVVINFFFCICFFVTEGFFYTLQPILFFVVDVGFLYVFIFFVWRGFILVHTQITPIPFYFFRYFF